MDLEPLSEAQIAALANEGDIMEETVESHADRIFRESLVPAARTLCDIAIHSKNEPLRARTAQYVVERGLGRVQDNPPEKDDPFKKLLAEVIVSDPEYARIAAGIVSGEADSAEDVDEGRADIAMEILRKREEGSNE